jgi:hypothetical protein
VQAKDKAIEMMELLDQQQQLICKVHYQYGPEGDRLARLTAFLPTRPQKLLADANVTLELPNQDGLKQQVISINTVDHVYHKGGRVCNVVYKDVLLGDKTVRLPVYVEVRRADDGRVLRTAELTNFRLVQMDKDQVWQAARSFAGLSQQDRWAGLAGLPPQPATPKRSICMWHFQTARTGTRQLAIGWSQLQQGTYVGWQAGGQQDVP